MPNHILGRSEQFTVVSWQCVQLFTDGPANSSFMFNSFTYFHIDSGHNESLLVSWFAFLKLLLRLYIFPPDHLLFVFPHVSNHAHLLPLPLRSLPTSIYVLEPLFCWETPSPAFLTAPSPGRALLLTWANSSPYPPGTDTGGPVTEAEGEVDFEAGACLGGSKIGS